MNIGVQLIKKMGRESLKTIVCEASKLYDGIHYNTQDILTKLNSNCRDLQNQEGSPSLQECHEFKKVQNACQMTFVHSMYDHARGKVNLGIYRLTYRKEKYTYLKLTQLCMKEKIKYGIYNYFK